MIYSDCKRVIDKIKSQCCERQGCHIEILEALSFVSFARFPTVHFPYFQIVPLLFFIWIASEVYVSFLAVKIMSSLTIPATYQKVRKGSLVWKKNDIDAMIQKWRRHWQFSSPFWSFGYGWKQHFECTMPHRSSTAQRVRSSIPWDFLLRWLEVKRIWL